MATSVRIAVVGDVHDDWNLQEDTKALQLLRVDYSKDKWFLDSGCSRYMTGDASFFTCLKIKDGGHVTLEDNKKKKVIGIGNIGDFGNENVELVRSVADLKFAKAVILGNHDAWGTQQFSERRKDQVQLQLECLGEEHVGYCHLDYPILKLSIVGGRPFSCGGEELFRKRLLAARYDVHDMDGSAKRIYEAALGVPDGHSAIFLAHNGPTGLGSNINDICGRDWFFGGGDHGDPDLARAISHLKETTKLSIPLVVFGHMHKELAYRNGFRKMIVVGDDNTIYLNAAIVPRVKRPANAEGTVRAFTLVEISKGKLEKIAEAWVSVIGDITNLEEEHILYGGGTEISV
ncbi:hypothetical protein U1Q18_028088 [Sarracenia purpurea var. burkii]